MISNKKYIFLCFFLIFSIITILSFSLQGDIVEAVTCPYGNAAGSCYSGTCVDLCCGNTCCSDSCGCTPNCTGKVCGSDGCGGSCGTCDWNTQNCTNGQCVPKTTTTTQGTTTTTQGTTTTTQGTTTTTTGSTTTTTGGTTTTTSAGTSCTPGTTKPCKIDVCDGTQSCISYTCQIFTNESGLKIITESKQSIFTLENIFIPTEVYAGTCYKWSDNCVKILPCCGVTCTAPAACSNGQCVTPCTGCITADCGNYSPNSGGCPSNDWQWLCKCTGPILGGYSSCKGECVAIPYGTLSRCINHICAESSNANYPSCSTPPGEPCGCSPGDGGSSGQPCTSCGCQPGLACCPQINGGNICLDHCASQQVCTPNSTQSCIVTVNGVNCDGTQTCKSDGTAWGSCVQNDPNCGTTKICNWKECDSDGVNCNVNKSGTFKANESCPVGCESSGCPNKICSWKECSGEKCNLNKSGVYSKNQNCPIGCTSDIQCITTHHCIWKECNYTAQTCSISKSGDYPLAQSCPTGCTTDSQCIPTKYSCNSLTGQCYADTNGSYTSLSTCQANCTASPPNTLSVSLTANKTSIKPNEDVQLTATPSNGVTPYKSYDWYIEDKSVSGGCHLTNPSDGSKHKGCQKMSYLPFFDQFSFFGKLVLAAVGNTNTIKYQWSQTGTYKIYVIVTDNANKTATSNTITITVTNTPTHLECNTNKQCIPVAGAGANLCITDSDCNVPPPPPPPPPPLDQCEIISFKINDKTNEDQDPLIVWVNASLTGYFSVNDICTSCEVTSNDNWNKTYDPLSSTYVTEQFKINTAGTYSYILRCIGDPDNPDDFDEDILSLATVQAINLPWWREIIPNLLPFLRGMIR